MSGDEESGLDDLDEAEAPSEWLTTLADMSMLLMTFFILLFSMSTLDVKKFSDSFDSVQNALGSKGKSKQAAPVSGQEMSALVEQARIKQRIIGEQRRVFENFRSFVSQKGLEGVLGATLESGTITISLPTGVLFPKDGVDLTDEGKVRLRTLHEFLIKTAGERINIRGFTDDLPPAAGSRFRDNWEVSSLRAVAVLRYMLSLGMAPNRLTATGLADLEPLYPNTTPEHRARNQRVEFVLERFIGE
ncbi:OmpA/MotB domain protein [Solidesulfovibrio carbinoliphilus subsp. oakridgensis]|uniref:OmpA/MotB domain protein n=1 Tax=Solidesulfovibrio carbinoliphilus subsp. oakridgensis TaxID=694327 RepID=G7QAL8_9BACT|nr:flagellar motor protein MotB [Solidesulfovibrio carbinoliphilus]EHJ49249.1 OmpA/MotB domain protein [Solidesulfovibrio carbinoliphilus subsp. oakridgensis]